jgi:predicted metalloprotease with PDZ domain
MRPSDLRNSVYVAGDLLTKRFEKDGLLLDVVMGRGFSFSIEEFGERALQIIKAQRDFMAEPAFPPFVITVMAVGDPLPPEDTRIAGAGLYHSFALFVPPKSRLDTGVEQLFSHELFHFWNGRILQAADPERALFWWIEGFTDYYGMRLLYDAGIWDAATYAGWLNRHLRDYAANPAINATNDEIQARFWSDRDSYGEVAYQRGQALGLRWHRLARQRGINEGVDKLLKALMTQQRQGAPPLSNSDIRRIGVQTLGGWFGEEFDHYVVGARTVDIPPEALAPRIAGELASIFEYELGFDREGSLRDKRIVGLKPGSAAAVAGLREGDRLTAWQIHPDSDRESSVTVSRDNKHETIRFYPRGRRLAVVQFTPAPKTEP